MPTKIRTQAEKNETFYKKAKLVHEDLYDYSHDNYVDSHTPFKIWCKTCNEFFLQRPHNHTNVKQGCPACGLKNRHHPLQKSNDKFIEQAKEKWKEIYDYSITIYKNKITKIKYFCNECKIEVEQSPVQHLKNGCPFCAGRGVGKHTKESFIEKAIKIHDKIYNYYKVEFNSIHNKVLIHCNICKKDFSQKASNHLCGNGCPYHKGGVQINQDEYIKRSKLRHGETFDYSNTEYEKAHNKVKIICKKHGEFEQFAYMHLQSEHCCPQCVAELTSSLIEKEIEDFIKLNYDGHIETNNRTILNFKEIDIYLPYLKIGFEINGNYYHCEGVVGKNYHNNKTNLAESKKIQLIHIFEHEIRNKKEIIFSRILNLLGKTQKIHARKTKIVNLTLEEKNDFLEKNHMQGKDNSEIYFGLKYNEKLVACMTFGKPRFNSNYDYELIRFASILNTSVVGGASKLLSHFKNQYKGSIISYSNRRWSTGNLYRKLKFNFLKRTNPGYFYYNLKNKKIRNRMACQKHKLKNNKFYAENLTEYGIMKLNGYDRIWDCGQDVWIN